MNSDSLGAEICSRCERPLLANEPRGLCSRCLFGSLVENAAPGMLKPAVEAPPRLAEIRRSTGEVGDRLGRYQLLKKLGEGGCGVVFMAQQSEPVNRLVALKVVKLGMGSEEVIARFEAERQALAVMDHPNIAKVYDAGRTDAGLPYFVMELAPGTRITRFCEGRRLPLTERLILFIEVCKAIQHAHQKGIVHRDIKPSNILVSMNDGVPVPKVIDFGIAKATQGNLTDKTLFTVVEHFLGTPAYMSPEQAGIPATDIDTRSDIYSLGVLLYELLTGRTPFDGEALLRRGIEELILTLRGVEPPRPSACLKNLSTVDLESLARSQRIEAPRLLGELRGDLDWIVMKCLEKDRARRYETVNGLAMDIQRHLDHQPVLARPPSVVYRLNKTVRRHKLPFLAGGLIVASLVIGLAVATYGLIQAAEHRRIAQKEQESTHQALARAQTAIAEAAFRAGDGMGMKAALEAVPPAWRDTTWEYLAAKADTSLATIAGGFIGVAAHPLRPGVFALGERGGGILFIQAATGERLQHFNATTRQQAAFYQRGLAFSPDGQRLAVGSLAQGGIAIYDVATGAALIEWEAPETDALEFSPDGQRLLQSSSIGDQVSLWDAAEGGLLWSRKGTTAAVFEPGAKRVIVAERRELLVLDAADGGLVRKFGQLRGHVQAVAVRPGGGFAATGDSEGFVSGIDLAEGRLVFQMPSSSRRIQFVDFTTDGRRIVSVAAADNQNQAIHVWDAETGTRLQSIVGGTSQPEGLRLHPLTDELMIAGSMTRTWALGVSRPRWRLTGGSTAAFFGADDSWLAPTGDGVGRFVVEGTNAVTRWTHAGGSRWRMRVSADGRVAAVTTFDNQVNESLILRGTENGFETVGSVKGVYAVSFVRLSPGGERLLVFIPGGTCSGHFDTATGAALPALQQDLPIMEIIDADWIDRTRIIGAVIAQDLRGSPRSEERLVMWDSSTGKVLRSERHPTIINCLAAAPDRATLAEGGDDELIRIRDGVTLGLRKIFRAHDGAITALAWHPTRSVLASASTDLTIKLWDVVTGECLEELRGPVKPAKTLSFSPSGRRLLSAGPDGTRVWEPAALQQTQP